MPTLNEFIAGFGIKEILLSIFILACIVLGREERRIFRRRSHEKGR